MAVALETLKIYEEMDVVEHVRRMGTRLRSRFEGIGAASPIVGEVRGAGLMLGIEIVADKENAASKLAPGLQWGPGSPSNRIAYENGLVAPRATPGFSPPLDRESDQDVDEIADRCARASKDWKPGLRQA